MYAERHQVDLTTAADGSATGYTPATTGRVLGVVLSVPGSGGLDNTADFAITAEATAEAILTLTNVNTSGAYYPRSQVHDATGAGLTYDGTRKVEEPVTLAKDRVKIVIAQGGNVKACTVYVIVG